MISTLALIAALQAGAPAGSRVELRSWKPTASCAATRAELKGTLKGSGLVAVRLTGPACEGWGWANVALFVPVQVASNTKAGEPVHFTASERELSNGRSYLSTVPSGSVATRNLPDGTVLEPQHIRAAGPAAGAEVSVIVRAAGLTLSQRGRVVACPGACAQLSNGRRVEGSFDGDRLIVELP